MKNGQVRPKSRPGCPNAFKIGYSTKLAQNIGVPKNKPHICKFRVVRRESSLHSQMIQVTLELLHGDTPNFIQSLE